MIVEQAGAWGWMGGTEATVDVAQLRQALKQCRRYLVSSRSLAVYLMNDLH